MFAEGYIIGAITALISVFVGYSFGRNWLDQRLRKPPIKPVQPTKQGSGTNGI